MGSALAVVTYVILRAGLISTPSESGATPDINDFGVAGISACWPDDRRNHAETKTRFQFYFWD